MIILVLMFIGLVSGQSDYSTNLTNSSNTTACIEFFGKLICIEITTTPAPVKCSINRFCDYYGICQKFGSFAELNPNCTGFKLAQNILFREITFFPSRKLILDLGFDFAGFNDLFQRDDSNAMDLVSFSFYYINGFDSSLTDVKYSHHWYTDTTYIFFKPVLNFYDKGRLIEECKSGAYVKNGSNMLSRLYNVKLVSPVYQRPLCVYVLQNLRLSELAVHGTDFLEIDWSKNQSDLGISIQTLSIYDAKKLDLNSNGLVSNMLKGVETLRVVQASMKRMPSREQLALLNSIQSIQLQIINFRGFFHSCGLEWVDGLNLNKDPNQLRYLLQSLNNNKTGFTLSLIQIFNDMFSMYFNVDYQNGQDYIASPAMFPYLTYQFPNEDLCLFAEWPHQRLVIPLINGTLKTKCSSACTVIWLHKNLYPLLKWAASVIALQNIPILNESFSNECITSWLNSSLPSRMSFDQVFRDCDFDQKLSLCSMSQAKNYHDPYFDLFDFKLEFDKIKLFVLTYILPEVSLFSAITNSIIIFVVIRNKYVVKTLKRSKTSKKPMRLIRERFYQYMLMNACINLALCLLRLLDSLIACVPGKFLMTTGIVEMRFEVFALTNQCHVKTVMIEWLVSYLKLMSNFFYIQMCISRMLLVGKDHGSIYLTLSAVKKKTYFIITSVISIALGTIVYFQQTTMDWRENRIHTYLTDYYYDQSYFWVGNLHSRTAQQMAYQNLNSSKASIPRISWLLAITLIYDAFSYLIFCILGIVIDVSTLQKLKESLMKKETIKMTREEGVQTDNVTLSEENREAERKMVVMIILNSVCNIVLRSAELFSFIFFVYSAIFPFTFRMFCLAYRECLAIDQLVDCGYLLSIGLNFFFYFFFNKNFNEATKLAILRTKNEN